MNEGPIAKKIREKLTAALSPEWIELVDDSARHAGHHHEGGMDAKPDGESHFNLHFREPQWAVTPGQSAVIYDGDICLGGGVIQ